jgi:alkylation response protein AidB-like acyl-CoA dehydrogenase
MTVAQADAARMLEQTVRPASDEATPFDRRAVARELGPRFAARAAAHDADDSFVALNYKELKSHRVFSAGVPLALGGGGASFTELSALLRELGRSCGATALALSMHSHLLAATVWRARQGQPVEALLRRIAAEQLVLVSTGASDWLKSSGRAERVDGGYRVTGRKIFGSGSPAGDLLVTSAPYEDPADGPTVLHFAISMRDPGVTVQDNWRALGMRGSGSNDVIVDGVFVPDSAISLRRPQGKWHPFFNMVITVALPLVMSAYAGVAEAARDLALANLRRKREDRDVWYVVGEMENALATGQMAVQSMVELCADYEFTPNVATANAMRVRKAIAAEALMTTAEKALEAVGGSGLYRSMGLERLVRDLHGAQFHPLQPKRQQHFSGRVALGLEPIDD